ncbi:hypothetical protein EI613_32720 (plasmid) [Azospirillum sp. 412522]|nr:hypothetical protein [Azospirillum sp. 412522]
MFYHPRHLEAALKLVRDARTLKLKAIASLRTAMTGFNSFGEDGRVTTVLLHLQHASEMLLKAALVQKRVQVFDREKQVSFGFEKCINLGKMHCGVTEDEAGILKAVDAMRDAAQHWFVYVAEDILYLHTRALVTAFDTILKRSLDDDLSSHLPTRVLPVSTMPAGDFDYLIDREYRLVADLLAPGRRAQDEARGRIRAMLAMESHVADHVEVSERDIERVVKAIKGGKAVADVFPRLMALRATATGVGPTVKIKIEKKVGAPVRIIASDDPEEAGAVREIDLRKRFHMSAKDLAARSELTPPKANAVRQWCGIDRDAQCCHVFQHGSMKFPCYSDHALTKMRQAIGDHGIDAIWAAHKGRVAEPVRVPAIETM